MEPPENHCPHCGRLSRQFVVSEPREDAMCELVTTEGMGSGAETVSKL
jgi:hypothetical protein